jgi:hypothetical protein
VGNVLSDKQKKIDLEEAAPELIDQNTKQRMRVRV